MPLPASSLCTRTAPQASPTQRSPYPSPYLPVRTRPMPCAPFLRATSASAGVSARVGGRRRRHLWKHTHTGSVGNELLRPTPPVASWPAHRRTHPPAFVHTPILRNESTVSMKPARSPADRPQVGAAGVGSNSARRPCHICWQPDGQAPQCCFQPAARLLLPPPPSSLPARLPSPPLTAHLRWLDRLLALQHLSSGAVEGQPVSFFEGAPPKHRCLRAVVHLQCKVRERQGNGIHVSVPSFRSL
jgi:hypothetical protein